MFPSSTNSSTLSESACWARDKPWKSIDSRAETAFSGFRDDSIRRAALRGVFRLTCRLVLGDVFLFEGSFLMVFMVFVGRRASLSPEDLLARLAFVFDLVGLLFVFLFFVFLFFGMAAVYHCDRPVVCAVSDKSISRRTLIMIYSGLHAFGSLALQTASGVQVVRLRLRQSCRKQPITRLSSFSRRFPYAHDETRSWSIRLSKSRKIVGHQPTTFCFWSIPTLRPCKLSEHTRDCVAGAVRRLDQIAQYCISHSRVQKCGQPERRKPVLLSLPNVS